MDTDDGFRICGGVLEGPWRSPTQLLAGQHLRGARSIHDDATAAGFGYAAGTIEGPTHFSQFVPLCLRAWGPAWFETGCLSVKFKAPSHAGEEVRALLRWPVDDAGLNEVWMVKRDGTEVLRGSASIGPRHPATALRQNLLRMQRRPVPASGLPQPGTRSGRITVSLPFDQVLGALYPFSLQDKLAVITEPMPWYTKDGGAASPWGRPIVPLEMVSVLLRHSSANFPFAADYPFVQMFAALEIQFHAGPLFVEAPYAVEHEVVAASDARQMDNIWIQTDVFCEKRGIPIATMLLNMVGFRGEARNGAANRI